MRIFKISSRFILYVTQLVLLVCLTSCDNPLKTIELGIANHSFQVEIADTHKARQRGLAFRIALAEKVGMLFVFDREQLLSFWMKDTVIPLSIAFISSTGEILEIRDMPDPGDLTPVYSQQPARYALEVNRGIFEKTGIHVGDRIRYDGNSVSLTFSQ